MEIQRIQPERLLPLLPERPSDGHKGTFGHLFVVAGARGFTGAARLCGEGGYRAGTGLVTVGGTDAVVAAVAPGAPELMTLLLGATGDGTVALGALDAALAFCDGKEAVAIGPGLTQNLETQRFVRAFIARCDAPLVIDADGLNALAGDTGPLRERKGPCVITPHPGEMARLRGRTTSEIQADRVGSAKGFADDHGCVVVLKGFETVVAEPDGACLVNPTGNSGMATGGTGDVLTGLIGGLIAQGMARFDAAILGVYLHGLAGDLAAGQKTKRAMIASDLLDRLPDAWRTLEGASEA